jgi:hypothetical protein
VAVFIDYQNVYKGARKAFGNDQSSDFTRGQIYPRRVGLALTESGRKVDPLRQLEVVRVYRGEPSAKHSPKGQSACQRQVRYWAGQARVQPFTRPLKYYFHGQDKFGDEIWEAREKGIDVQLALDMVMGAKEDDYDVAVLFSGDTDLIPAVEGVRRLGKIAEVASWRSLPGYERMSRLTTPGVPNPWCHWLDKDDYGRLWDPTDYTKPLPGEPTENP